LWSYSDVTSTTPSGHNDTMKLLLASPDHARLGLLLNRLRDAGVDCEIRNEHVFAALPAGQFTPELWVLRDEQFEEANELLRAWTEPLEDGV
jgi:hypothetical protein